MKSMVLGLAACLSVTGAALPVMAQEAASPVSASVTASPKAKALALRYLKAIEFENLLIAGMGPMLDAFAAQQPELP